jgi:hypothetical protein
MLPFCWLPSVAAASDLALRLPVETARAASSPCLHSRLPTVIDVERLQWSDPIVAAEATEIASDWSTAGSRVHQALRRRVERDRANAGSVEVRRWLASATGLGPIWPR